jgi:hypothetical protein
VTSLPTAKLGDIEISRLIIGGNPFSWGSYFSQARKRWAQAYLTDDRIVEMLEKCEEEGINAFVGRGDDHIFGVLDEFERRNGRRINWIAQTAPERGPHEARDLRPLNTPHNVREIVRHDPIAIFIHGGVTGAVMDLEAREIDHVEDWLKLMQDHGVLAGICSHNHEAIDIAEERGYNPDFFMITLNPLRYSCAGDPERISRSIKGTEKPVLAFKTMAMGRIPPDEAIQLTLSCIKDTDFMVVGMTIPEEIEENAEWVRKYTDKEDAGDR